jgi:hypothetical protein
MASGWLLCSYKLPRDPSRLRLAVWRRLQRLGALMLHDGLWTLPGDAATREAFEWLAEDIEERGGRAMLWEARSLAPAQDAIVTRMFRAAADERYAALAEAAVQLARLAVRKSLPARAGEQALQRLRALERALRLERRRDFFRAAGRAAADAAVRGAIEQLRTRIAAGDARGRLHAVGH